MIGRLSGVVSCFEDNIIIDVSGVGYLVYCSARTIHNLKNGEYYQFLVETHVREDHINLYGFLSADEKQIFCMLQSVNGIGPRLALTILSTLTPQQIELAVASRDKDMLKSVSGVGAKMAEKIIIELKDRFKNNFISSIETGTSSVNSNIAIDSVSALVNLGINRIEAHNTVNKIILSNPDISIDELITLVLKKRG